MNEIDKWHDLVRRHFDSYEDALKNLSACLDLLRKSSAAVLQRKLDSGYTQESELNEDYIQIVCGINTEDVSVSQVYVEMKTSVDLRKK